MCNEWKVFFNIYKVRHKILQWCFQYQGNKNPGSCVANDNKTASVESRVPLADSQLCIISRYIKNLFSFKLRLVLIWFKINVLNMRLSACKGVFFFFFYLAGAAVSRAFAASLVVSGGPCFRGLLCLKVLSVSSTPWLSDASRKTQRESQTETPPRATVSWSVRQNRTLTCFWRHLNNRFVKTESAIG